LRNGSKSDLWQKIAYSLCRDAPSKPQLLERSGWSIKFKNMMLHKQLRRDIA